MKDYKFPTYVQQLEQIKMPAGRRKVMLAAIQLFSKQGYHNTSTAQIANEAGLSQATVFKYFKTKDELLLGVLQPMVNLFSRSFIDEMKQCSDLKSLVAFIVQNRFAFISANKELLKIIFQELLTGGPVSHYLKDSVQELLPELLAIIHANLEADPKVSHQFQNDELIRIFVAPIYTYVTQRYFLEIDTPNEAQDLHKIEQQILQNLYA